MTAITRRSALGGMSIVLFGTHGLATAQDYPTRPVRVVIGFAAGGATDIMARLLSTRLAERLGGAPFIGLVDRQHRRGHRRGGMRRRITRGRLGNIRGKGRRGGRREDFVLSRAAGEIELDALGGERLAQVVHDLVALFERAFAEK